MRVGILLLPELDWSLDRERWQRADSAGFDHAWTYDHLAWRTLADGPWHATVPTLVAAALSTARIRLGTLVTTPNVRHPVPLAKDLMTLDVMSGGRLQVAVGAGAPGNDATVLGLSELGPADRHHRFVEFRTLLGQLLEHRVTDWRGTWFSACRARMNPGPVQQPRPPLLTAAEGPKGMKLAVTAAARPGDGWVTLGVPGGAAIAQDVWWSKVVGSATRFDAVAAECGGTPPGFVRLLNMESRISTVDTVDDLVEMVGRAAELGFTDVVLPWPRSTEPFRASEHLLDEIIGALPRLRSVDA